MIIGVFRQLRWFCYIRYDVILSFLIYSAGCHLFRELCLHWHSVHHSLPPVRKCSNVTDPYELPDFWLPNSPCRNTFHYKIWDSESTRKNTGCKRFEAASDWCMSWVEQSVIDDGIDQWRRRLHACIRTRRKTFWIFTWHKLAKTLLTVTD